MPARTSPRPAASRCLAALLALVVVASFHKPCSAAPPTAQERAELRAAEVQLRRAGYLFRTKKYEESGKLVEQVQTVLAALADSKSDGLPELTGNLQKRVSRARALLKQQGVEISPGGDTGEVSFSGQIAPLLVAKCGACHVQRARGKLSMASYAALAKGSDSGVVVMPGDADGSRVVELIASGDMPRGGGKVSDDELALLKRWIDQGAKFDGSDPSTPLANLAPDNSDKASDKLAAVPATGKEEVQFARDLGKVFIERCLECHGQQNPRGNFSVATFDRLLRGGDRGMVIDLADPAGSLLVKKLRGEADGERMPLGRPPLPDEVIARIEKWIASGARFDGADATAPLEETVALVIALGATHDELSKSRAALAEKNWRLIMPDVKPRREEMAGVLVYGNVGPELSAEVAHTAKEQMAHLARLFKRPPNEPLVKGRLTLYVFAKRYDYSEVGVMLEQREIPAAWHGHWRYTGVDAYGCIVLDGDEVPPGLIAQQITGAYLASLGEVPRWFAEGSARAIAARVDPKDHRVQTWDDEVDRIVQSTEQPEAFLSGKLAPQDTDVLSYSFVKYLMTGANRYTNMVTLLQEGKPFDEAFQSAYRATPEEVATVWKARAGRRRRR